MRNKLTKLFDKMARVSAALRNTDVVGVTKRCYSVTKIDSKPAINVAKQSEYTLDRLVESF